MPNKSPKNKEKTTFKLGKEKLKPKFIYVNPYLYKKDHNLQTYHILVSQIIPIFTCKSTELMKRDKYKKYQMYFTRFVYYTFN